MNAWNPYSRRIWNTRTNDTHNEHKCGATLFNFCMHIDLLHFSCVCGKRQQQQQLQITIGRLDDGAAKRFMIWHSLVFFSISMGFLFAFLHSTCDFCASASVFGFGSQQTSKNNAQQLFKNIEIEMDCRQLDDKCFYSFSVSFSLSSTTPNECNLYDFFSVPFAFQLHWFCIMLFPSFICLHFSWKLFMNAGICLNKRHTHV